MTISSISSVKDGPFIFLLSMTRLSLHPLTLASSIMSNLCSLWKLFLVSGFHCCISEDLKIKWKKRKERRVNVSISTNMKIPVTLHCYLASFFSVLEVVSSILILTKSRLLPLWNLS